MTDAPSDTLRYAEHGREFNVAMREHADIPDPTARVGFVDFLRFWTKEFKWGTWVASVRRGRCNGLDTTYYPKLGLNDRCRNRKEVDLIHIEDPFDVERDLSCVLAPGNSARLKRELEISAKEYLEG